MLIEIKSDAFRENTIKFHQGLNVVLGDEQASNSIGKSNLLLNGEFAYRFKSKFGEVDIYALENLLKYAKEPNKYVKFPSTKLLTEKSEIEYDNKIIIKPVYSRFEKSIILNVVPTTIEDIEVFKAINGYKQERIECEAICNYVLILNGEVLAHVVYR